MMSQTTHWFSSHDQRCEVRETASAKIFWRHPEDRALCVGWLSDVARSSISFITPRTNQPAIGDRIEVDRPGHDREAFCVARVAEWDGAFTLVACRTAARWAMEGRRQATGEN